MTEATRPRAAIRRFDVFAEYNRLKAQQEDKLSAARAKGYGLWLAKVVAARKFGRLPESKDKSEKKDGEQKAKINKQGWHELSGVAQTSALFDKEIAGRMGTTFYRRVFSPAVRKAFESGKAYVEIRDTIRAGWKP